MRVGELISLLSQYPEDYPVYGTANSDEFDPDNRFVIEKCLCQEIDYKHYKEPVLILEFDVS